MAQFYGSIQGNKGVATRMGTKSSGLEAHIRGWNKGIRVKMRVNDKGEDEAVVYLTAGSNGHEFDTILGVY